MKNILTVLVFGACALIPFLLLLFLTLIRRFREEDVIGGTPLATSLHISFCGIHFSLCPSWGSILLLCTGILLILSALVLLSFKPSS